MYEVAALSSGSSVAREWSLSAEFRRIDLMPRCEYASDDEEEIIAEEEKRLWLLEHAEYLSSSERVRPAETIRRFHLGAAERERARQEVSVPYEPYVAPELKLNEVDDDQCSLFSENFWEELQVQT